MVKSPCISICTLKDKVCIGCNRSVEEITVWSDLTDQEKQAVLNRISQFLCDSKKGCENANGLA